ncbi:hypothetical protein WBG06_17810 [Nocardioides sp. CCNWLW239]|uniref:hypothetical protein n=1 Tax=Nocardioides sp. CCNWLW239 TaxID=3128902 RepID=UPI0030175FB5
MVGQVETSWTVMLLLSNIPVIVALFVIIRGAVARGRVVALDVLDITMVLVFCWIGALVYFLILFLRHRRDSRTAVAAPVPAITETEETLARVDEAYARAWGDARSAADDVLIDVLVEAGLGPSWTEPGRPRADLLLGIWRAGATPRSASRQLREAFDTGSRQ